MYLWLSSETSCFQSPTASLSPGLLCTAVMFRTPGWGKESWFCSHSGAPSRPISGNGCCSLISPKASYGPSRIIHWSITSPLNPSPLDPSHLWMSQHPKTTIHPPLKLSQREMVSAWSNSLRALLGEFSSLNLLFNSCTQKSTQKRKQMHFSKC